MANEGARLVRAGVARRPSDVDAAAALSGIFPRWRGGPMYQADLRGLLLLRADLRKRAVGLPGLYTPDPLIDQLIADGKTFAALDGDEGAA
jgi:3-hydroxyacyl-CoA dehydrogenase